MIIPKMQSWKNLQTGALQHCVSSLDWLAKRRGRMPEQPAHLETGERGEEAAFFFLRRSGFTIVARRWNDGPSPGDLDLIAWHEDMLCFIEVKTRTTLGMAPAQAAVDQNKRKILRRLAGQYMRQLPGDDRPETRFDIVTVYELAGKPREVRLIAGAFGWSERSVREYSN
ncbi:YraN family protein [Acidicapsa ligni]|uniref:YraN family protein n=1 Tax=Acidicapsa ligni TaxID=542300 RepID=UPI0021E0B578|nr:YraN family protein [Acidicapsa ligni]